MKRFLFLFIIFSLSFYLPQTTSAQAPSTQPADQLINVTIVPEAPKALQDVNISIESYSYDLSHSKISWYINGALRDSGVGKDSLNFKTGDVGSVTKIRYQIETPDGVVFGDSVTVAPGDVTLLWESTAYTHPFYKGKALFSFEGTARLVAVPNLMNKNGVKYKPEELVYTWKRGMGTDTDASGYGKNVFFWNGGIVSEDEEIQVDVSDVQNTTKATASITITPKEAEILAYENSPSLGILWNKAIENNYNLTGSEVSFVAAPYYFNNPDNDAVYSWFVNGVRALETTKYITFRNTTGDTGYSDINLDLTSQKKILQSANASFKISTLAKNTNAITNIFNSLF